MLDGVEVAHAMTFTGVNLKEQGHVAVATLQYLHCTEWHLKLVGLAQFHQLVDELTCVAEEVNVFVRETVSYQKSIWPSEWIHG